MKLQERYTAVELRKLGYSIKEIAGELKVSKGTVSLWVENVELNKHALARLRERVSTGQLAAAQAKRKATKDQEAHYFNEGIGIALRLSQNKKCLKLLCAIMYWCEGGKNPRNGLYFTNSDPKLIAKFLLLLRSSFEIDESKFHPCIHLHAYHSPEQQLDFWSKVTNIPKEQFIKPYLKPNSGKRIREGYQGCIGIRYHSNDLARQLNAIAKAFLSI